jgi:hypothetical protein
MKQFARFFDLFEKVSGAVPADRHYMGNLELLADKGRLSFIQDTSTNETRRFVSWFRWVFLALSIAFSINVYRGTAATADRWVVIAVSWCFIVFALGIGVVGAFVVVPIMTRVFRRIETLGTKNEPMLPSFDLINRTVNPPDSKSGYPFDCVVGLKSVDDVDGWRKLVMLTSDNSVVFLVNYPVSEAEKFTQMLDRISELTSIELLE